MIKPLKVRVCGEHNEYQAKDAYMQKKGDKGFIGLHAIGETDENGVFHNMEAWANAYDENRKFVGSIFRIFGPLEEVVQDLELDGFEVVEWIDEVQ
jgi:hypothetical protein